MERPAAALWVDPKVHAAEVARFRSKIVAGPRDEDCSIWTGSIGADGYGRNYITPKGIGFCVRPNRYACAGVGTRPWRGRLRIARVRYPVVREGESGRMSAPACDRRTQQENMRRMARARRGGGRPTIRGLGREARRARSVALRDAVRDRASDADAVYSALLGSEPRLF